MQTFYFSLQNESIDQLESWIRHFVTTDLQFPALLLLEGPLGAGKTTFTRMLAKELGCNTNFVNSPTFAIHQQYLVQKNNSRSHSGQIVHIDQVERIECIDRIDHFDLYRLESEEDLETSGFWEILAEPAQLLIVEWPSRIQTPDWIPEGYFVYKIDLQFKHIEPMI